MKRKKGKPVIICDSCRKVLGDIKPKIRRQGEIEYTYLKCRWCGFIFVISATDEALRQEIKQYQDMIKRMGDSMPAKKEAEKIKKLLLAMERSREIKKQHPFELKSGEM